MNNQLKEELKAYQDSVSYTLNRCIKDDMCLLLQFSPFDAGIVEFCDYYPKHFGDKYFSILSLLSFANAVYQTLDKDTFMDCDTFDCTLRLYIKRNGVDEFLKLIPEDTDMKQVRKFIRFYNTNECTDEDDDLYNE